MSPRHGTATAFCLAAGLALAAPAPPALAQDDGPGAGAEVDALERQRMRRESAVGAPIRGAERPGYEQDLRDTRRRLHDSHGVSGGYDRARLRALEREREARERDRRRSGPAFGGDPRRVPRGGSSLIPRQIPETELGLDALEGETNGDRHEAE